MHNRSLSQIVNSAPFPSSAWQGTGTTTAAATTAVLFWVRKIMTLRVERVGAASEFWSFGGGGDGNSGEGICGGGGGGGRCLLLRGVLLCVGGGEVVALGVETVCASESHD